MQPNNDYDDDSSEDESDREIKINKANNAAIENFYTDLEKSTMLYIDFWSQLSDDAPELTKLEELGLSISKSNEEIEQHWHRLLRTISNVSKALAIYQKYLIEIQNDKEASEHAFDEAEKYFDEKTKRKAKNKLMDLQDDDEEDSDDSADEAILPKRKDIKLRSTKKVRSEEEDSDDDNEGEEEREEGNQSSKGTNTTRDEEMKFSVDIQTSNPAQNKSTQQHSAHNEAQLAKKFNQLFRLKPNLVKTHNAYISISTLSWIINLVVIFLLLAAGFDYYLSFTRFRILANNLNALDASNQRISELQNIVSKVIDLELIEDGIYDMIEAEDILKQDIGRSIAELKGKHLNIAFDPIDLADDIAQKLTDHSVRLYYKVAEDEIQSKVLTLSEGTLQSTNSAANIQKLQLNQIDEKNPDVYYITYNNFNEFYLKLRETADLYSFGVSGQIATHQRVFLYEAAAVTSLLFIVLIVLIPIASRLNKKKERILKLFLDIPDPVVNILYNRCENFLSSWPIDENNASAFYFEDEKIKLPPPQKPHKTRGHIGTNKTSRRFSCKIFFALMLAAIFFQISFLLSRTLLTELHGLMKEYNATSVAESYFTFINNAEKQVLIDDQYPVAANRSAQEVLESMIKYLYRLSSDIQQQHSLNIKIHTERFKNYYNKRMISNPCADLVDVIERYECEDFAHGVMTHGMTLALSRHFEHMRQILVLYRKYKDNPMAEFERNNEFKYVEVYKPVEEGNNKQKNNWLNLLKTYEAREIDKLQHLFVRHIFRSLMDQLNLEIDERVQWLILTKSILWGVFLVIVAFGYVCLLGSWVSELRRDTLNTMAMLPLMPTRLAANLANVRALLNSLPNVSKKSRR